MSAAADDHRDDPPVSPQVAALQASLAAYKLDNQRLKAENDALKRGSPDDDRLQALKALVGDGAPYERARRSAKRGILRSEQVGGRLFSTSKWVREWQRITGR